MPQLIDELETARIFKAKEDYVTHLWWEGRPEAYVIFHSPTLAQALKLTAHQVTGRITSDLSRLTPADVMPESRVASLNALVSSHDYQHEDRSNPMKVNYTTTKLSLNERLERIKPLIVGLAAAQGAMHNEVTYIDDAPRVMSHDDGYVGYEPEDACIECIDDFSYEDEPPPPNQWDATVDAALLSEDITL